MDVAPTISQIPNPRQPAPSSIREAAVALSASIKESLAAWPRSAQLAGVFVLGAVTALIAMGALGQLRGAHGPSTVDSPPLAQRFDLNTARHAELLQLPGVGPSLADRIDAYRKTNGAFRTVDDLRNVPGIGPSTLERLRPLVQVSQVEPPAREPAAALAAAGTAKASEKKGSGLKSPIDINRASLKELQLLPGIGPKMSQRIVDEREKRPFATVEELRRVPGIGPKTYDKLKPLVTVERAEAPPPQVKAIGP
jgi:competence protein ComEA